GLEGRLGASAELPGGGVEASERLERIGPVADRLPDGRRRALPDSRKDLQRALPGELVLGIDEEAQEREHVLDVALLEEPRAGPDLVGDAAPDELDLELERLEVGAVEDGDVLEPLSLVPPLEDPLADEA